MLLSNRNAVILGLVFGLVFGANGARAQQPLVVEAPTEVRVGSELRLRVLTNNAPVEGVTVRVTGPTDRLGTVNASALNVRSTPEVQNNPSNVLIALPQNTRVLVLGQAPNGWYQIVTPNGVTGYVSNGLLSNPPPVPFLGVTPYGQPLGATDAEGELATGAFAIAPATVTIAAQAPGGASATATIRVVAALPTPYDRVETVAPGITFRDRLFLRNNEPFRMQILTVDAEHPAVDLLPVLATDQVVDKETTSSMARRYGAAAAVNGGYFVVSGTYQGDPVGVYAKDQEVISDGFGRTALLLFQEQDYRERVGMGLVDFQGRVTANDGTTRGIDGINRARDAANLLLVFRPVFGPSTRTNASGVEVILDAEQRVVRVADGVGDAVIPRDGSVLSGSGTGATWLREHAVVGATLQVNVALVPNQPAPRRFQAVVGGGPRLITNATITVGDPVPFGHENTRNPRTAVGVTRDNKLLFIVVDGRQPQLSVGMRLDELAAEMLGLGAVEATNLDGGGSSTMVVNDRVRNAPSDGSERPVSDALLIFSTGDLPGLTRLLDRLVAGGGQITPAAEEQLRQSLERAVVSNSQNNRQAAAQHLRTLQQQIAAEAGKGVSTSAAALLQEPVDAILEIWGDPASSSPR